MFNLATKEEVRILHRRVDALFRLLHEHFENNKKRDEVLLSNAETVNKILKEITGSWSDKTTFHGKAIKKGGKKRD